MPSPPFQPPTGPVQRQIALEQALERVAESLGSDVRFETVRTAATRAGGERAGVDALGRACRAMGFAVDPVQAPPWPVSRGGALVAPDGAGGWLILRAGRGARAELLRAGAQGTTRARVRRRDLESMSSGPWTLVTPRRSLDTIAASRSPELATSPWLRLLRFLSIERRELGVVLIYAIVVGALTLAVPVASQALVNSVAFGVWLQPLVILGVLLSGVLVLSGALTVMEAYVVEVLQRRVLVHVADDFGRRLPAIGASARDEVDLSERALRCFDALTIQKALSGLLLDGLAVTLQTFVGMILLAFYHPLLLLFDGVLVVLLLWVHLLGRGAVATAHAESAAKYRLAFWLQGIAAAPSRVGSMSARARLAVRTAGLSREYLRARRAHFRVLLRQLVGGVGLYALSTVALLGVGGWLVLQRQLTLGQLVAAELVIAAMGAGFVKLGKNLEKVYDLNVAVLKLGEVVDLPVERVGGELVAGEAGASLALRDVVVERGGRRVLRVASLDVPQGQRLRVLGSAGGGVTSLLEVLAAQRPPSAGTLRVDGVCVERADLEQMRDQIAFVPAHPRFLPATIADNLLLTAAGDPPPARLHEVLELVGVRRAVEALPGGLAEPIRSDGAPLSSGQARRLALAEALLASPRLLVLDHALDDLGLEDTATRRLLQAVLGPEAPWTVVVATREARVAALCDATFELRESNPEAA